MKEAYSIGVKPTPETIMESRMSSKLIQNLQKGFYNNKQINGFSADFDFRIQKLEDVGIVNPFNSRKVKISVTRLGGQSS